MRLLQLSTESGVPTATLMSLDRVLETDPDPRWATLSFVHKGEGFGDEPGLGALTASTSDTLQSGVSFDHFPAFIRSKMEWTLSLGIRYLWTDTLCLFQDSTALEPDPLRERKYILDIFARSEVALAECWYVDGPEEELLLRPLRVPVSIRPAWTDTEGNPLAPNTYRLTSSNALQLHVKDGDLFQHGREALRISCSRRVIFFGRDQVWWQRSDDHPCFAQYESCLGAVFKDGQSTSALMLAQGFSWMKKSQFDYREIYVALTKKFLQWKWPSIEERNSSFPLLTAGFARLMRKMNGPGCCPLTTFCLWNYWILADILWSSRNGKRRGGPTWSWKSIEPCCPETQLLIDWPLDKERIDKGSGMFDAIDTEIWPL